MDGWRLRAVRIHCHLSGTRGYLFVRRRFRRRNAEGGRGEMLMYRFAKRAALPALLAIMVGLVGSAGAQAGTRPNVGQRFVWRGDVRIFMGHSAPPTTKDCEQQIHIACYAPFQLQNSYDLNSLYNGGWDGTGTTIAVIDSFGSPTALADLTGHTDRVYSVAFGPDGHRLGSFLLAFRGSRAAMIAIERASAR
jgi:hypothetical protein